MKMKIFIFLMHNCWLLMDIFSAFIGLALLLRIIELTIIIKKKLK